MTSKEKTEAFLNALESEAMKWIEKLAAYRTYEGTDPSYEKKAKAGLGVIGKCVNLHGSMVHRENNELVRMRLLGMDDKPVGLLQAGPDHDA